MITVLFAAPDHDWEEFEGDLNSAFEREGLEVSLVRDAPSEEVDYIIYAPTSGLRDFSRFSNLKGVQSLWAGVEKIVGNTTLEVPLARMVDYGLREGMVEYCVGHTMRHHLDLDLDICRADRKWEFRTPPLARDRKVAVLGVGALGAAVAQALADLNFEVLGWSRSEKDIEGVQCFSGNDGLDEVLKHAEIVVLLLPRTPQTENVLDARRLALMPKGAVIINPGRGPLIDDDALLAALNEGHIRHATLDVFRVEPLPQDHAYWSHPRVTVTPHLASDTRPASAARLVADNLRRSEAGEPMLHLVDRSVGY